MLNGQGPTFLNVFAIREPEQKSNGRELKAEQHENPKPRNAKEAHTAANAPHTQASKRCKTVQLIKPFLDLFQQRNHMTKTIIAQMLS